MVRTQGRKEAERWMALLWVVALVSATMAQSSCAPALRAHFDRPEAGGIIWPGPPEKPRIRYLWSLYSLLADEGKFAELFLGSGFETADPGSIPYLMRPFSIWVEGRKLYVTDQGPPRITVVDMDTGDVKNLGYDGFGQLYLPIGIAVTPDGTVYAADAEMGTVNVYDPSGKFKGYLVKRGVLERPTGITFEKRRGRVYVVDSANHVVVAYDRSGERVLSFGRRGSGEGEFNYPTNIAVDGDGMLYVTDALNFRIQIFDPEGNFLSQFGRYGDTYDSLEKPKGIAVDGLGHIYVVDAAQDRVKIFDREGRLLLYFGENGRFPGQFVLPAGIYIDSRDRIYVADTYNMRIQAFQFLGE